MDQALAKWNKSTGSSVDLGKALRELQSAGEADRGIPLSAAALFVGQKQTALDALPIEAQTPGIDLPGFIWIPVYQSLRSEPRFREFLAAMKMPEYWRAAGWNQFCHPKGEHDFACDGP